MSIERSGPAVSPKVSQGAEVSGGKSKAKPGDGAEGAAGAGFLALLTSFVPDAVEADPSESPLAQTPSTEPLTEVVAPDPEADQSDNLAMLMAQASEVAIDKHSQRVVPSQVAAAAPVALVAPLLGAQQVPAMADDSLILGGEDIAGKFKAPAEAQAAVARPVLKHALPSAATEKPDVAVDPLDAGKTAVVVKADAATSALLDRTQQAIAARVLQNLGTSHLQSAAATTAADSRSATATSVLHDLASTPSLASSAAASSAASSGWHEGLIRPSDRPGSRLAGSQSVLSVEGAVGGSQVFQAGSRVDLPSAMVNPSMPSFESTVAEKLNFWIARGVQNAELELDGFGDEPVAVRISLKGDEAQVAFRTDQPEIRRMLEGASAQLKDLLANEGVLLSQVSVGTSDRGDSDRQGQRPPSSARTTAIESPGAAKVQNTGRAGVSVGTAVDLFV